MSNGTNVSNNVQRVIPIESDMFLNDVVVGLQATPKTLDPKYFYDENGSRLFEKITKLPEYYITRTETRILQRAARDISDLCGDTRTVVEFGSGSGRRSEMVLRALPKVERYVSIDVSPALLDSTVQVVESSYPDIQVCCINADFTNGLHLPGEYPGKRLGFLPGSTIGNFHLAAAISILRNARRALGAGSRMLLGVDLIKPADTLERAYDDSQGVTAAFNKNLLVRINRELGGNFDLGKFVHHAFFNREFSRVEMHLSSQVEQQVTVDEQFSFYFREGESIHTENSHKYTLDEVRDLTRQAGWQPKACWMDEDRLFSVHLVENTP